MNPKYRFPILNAIRGNRRLYAAICIPAFIVAFAVAFSFESGSQAAVKKGKKGQKSRKFNIEVPGGLELLQIDEAKAQPKALRNRRANAQSPIAPAAIPVGTPVPSVSFVAFDLTSAVKAIADTNGDLVPDGNSTEDFIESADPANEIIPSMTYSPKTENFYVSVMAAGGRKNGMGQMLVVKNSTGNFVGMQVGTFSTGLGTPIGLAVRNTPAGDILYVASVEFSGERFLDFNASDSFRITAYLPSPNGTPDGMMTKTVFDRGAKLGNNTINRSFGGMCLDDKGNLFVQVGTRTAQTLGGAILAFSDSDNDMIADKAAVYSAGTSTNPVAATASSLVALPGGRLAAFGIPTFEGQSTQIVFYNDVDGDLVADGDPTVFATLTNSFRGFALGFGEGTSTFTSSQMDFADGQAVFTYIGFNSADALVDSGLALIKDDGTGKGGTPMKVFEALKSGDDFGVLTLAFGVPRKGDSTPPTVKVNSPNGGETATGNTMLPISFTSSDDTGVASHDIALSTDGGTTFPITLASGLSGTTQSFNFLVPASIETTTARIRVTAKDAGGNMASDASDANFIIQRPSVADTMPPTVNITAPAAGATLNGGSTTAINFTSADNVGVASHNIQFASDGTNFNTTVATGLPGSANSFQFTVPTAASTNAAIRVQAIDSSGNIGSATVGMLKIVSDTVKPTVTVTAPKTKDKLKGGQSFAVTFTSSDNTAVVSHEIQLSKDNGATFATLNAGLPGNVQSFQITVPTGKVKKGVIKVIARDAAGNSGEGVSGVFKIK